MAALPDTPAIAVHGLVKRYGAVTAVEDLTFSVPAGSTVALLGGNGAGKTTTLSMLLGVLEPTAGSIHIFGKDMLADRHAVLPRMNFSSPYVDLPGRLTIRQNLTIYAHLYSLSDVRGRIARLAEELDIATLLDRPTGRLSAGQKTRVALAKALLNDPDLLILDEPTASLDPDTGDWIRTYLEQYQARSGATIFLASHNMAEVERLCDTVLMMRNGVIRDQGTPADLLSRYGRESLEEVFLDIARDRRTAAEVEA
ncbi:ABC transporter ATP-binding protein [Novispirillum itersonii]|uniref:ABC-2 type transport system ATP-binding protein n=1 Tax=Novispirillum itersonii TaxID=189 RepID=A0A7W9ZEJ6_NOVIT|nr:ABC transporter ATP-binding protein [Novispirillum itersonii]MBB6209795.1 ABC-2 type transport system ATP-binding protein [Novispirillum itersonii]